MVLPDRLAFSGGCRSVRCGETMVTQWLRHASSSKPEVKMEDTKGPENRGKQIFGHFGKLPRYFDPLR